MAMTREQADKIKVDKNVIVGFSGAGGDISAEQLAKWAYRRLKTWPDLLNTAKDVIADIKRGSTFSLGSKQGKALLQTIAEAEA